MRYVYAGRKRAQLKAAKAAAAAQLASTLVEAAEAVGPEAATEADADVGGVMGDDVSIAPTEQVDAPDDSEGAAPLALALAQTDATETALRPVDAEGLTLQPSDNATGDRGLPLHLEANRAAPSDDFGVGDWKLPAKKRRHAVSPSTSLSPSPAWGANSDAAAGACEGVEVTGSLEETESVEETEPMEEIEHAPLTSEAAVLQATAAGLTLEPSTNASGYKGIFVDGARLQGKRRGSEAKIFNVRVKRAGTEAHLGFYATAEEGALVYARAQAQAEATNAKRMTLTVEEAVAQAEMIANANAGRQRVLAHREQEAVKSTPTPPEPEWLTAMSSSISSAAPERSAQLASASAPRVTELGKAAAVMAEREAKRAEWEEWEAKKAAATKQRLLLEQQRAVLQQRQRGQQQEKAMQRLEQQRRRQPHQQKKNAIQRLLQQHPARSSNTASGSGTVQTLAAAAAAHALHQKQRTGGMPGQTIQPSLQPNLSCSAPRVALFPGVTRH